MPSSADGMGQDLLQSHTQPNGGLLLQRATWGEEPVELPSTGSRMEASTKADPDKITEGALRHPQHTKGWPGTRSHKPWRMGENNIELPTMDHMMTDATTAATETNGHVCVTTSTQHGAGPPADAPPTQGEVLVFHIDINTLRDEDQDRSRPHVPQMGDLHCRMDTEEVRGVMVPVPQFETDKTDQSQRQKRPLPEHELPGTDRWEHLY